VDRGGAGGDVRRRGLLRDVRSLVQQAGCGAAGAVLPTVQPEPLLRRAVGADSASPGGAAGDANCDARGLGATAGV
jgi:hypothetical protein